MKLLSPKELAAAIGVSESSIKRWVDEGRIEATRTAGGHRRIDLAEAVRYLRESRQKLILPGLLGFSEEADDTAAGNLDEAGEKLYQWLLAGNVAAAQGLLAQLYIHGHGLAAIFDGPLRQALARIGLLWLHGASDGIFVEHRALQICLGGVHQLRSLLPKNQGGPLAIGGTPPPDPAQLPSLMVATVMAGEGFEAVNLGPDLPLSVLGNAVLDKKPALVWLSLCHGPDAATLCRELDELYTKTAAVGAVLVVGGQAAPALCERPREGYFLGQTLEELVGFVRGLGLIG